MSVSTEVQRTLVKSPPELWAELGNQEGLARHLCEIGEIRVTKTEPESKVEWEADGASGFVEIAQSGWGTKVTLSLTRELPEVEDAAEPAPEVAAEVEASEPETVDEPAVEREPEPELETEPVATEPVPKQGFFARLFKRRRPTLAATEPRPQTKLQPEPEPQTESQPEPELQPEPEPAIEALALPEPVYPDPPPKPVEPEPSADLAAELAQLEAQMQQENTELLTGVLDRLGAAHHRPFSRA
jgi:hypothetical protein